MEVVMQQKTNMRQILSDVLLDISWAKIAQKYFGKSSSWLYHKLDGIDGNGGTSEFSTAERLTLKNSLNDLGLRLQTAAAKI